MLVFNLFILSSKIASAAVVINEIMPHPSNDDDWVELYNTSDEEFDISGWQLSDSSGIYLTIPEKTIMASSSASFIIFSKYRRLNNSGDEIKLADRAGNVIDRKSYNNDPGVDISLGRYPDGADNWGILSLASPNKSNLAMVPIDSPTLAFTPTIYSTNKPTVKSTVKPTVKPTSILIVTSSTKEKDTKIETVFPTEVANISKIITITPKLTITDVPISDYATDVLGESLSNMVDGQATDIEKIKKDKNLPLVAIFILGGIILITSAVVVSIFYLKKSKKGIIN